ncbi:MAG: GTP cyclohydrolase 1 [Candidatus Peregrinibacteria bacterium GW2011_GWA2_33_10]|nr:MAG: GTP cyclohydrolase 1 [Candidatus Peregrinibacteria bacterium GW2011_GWA2_33_10]KKP41054.1 MAG: GTP cyclohydrolase I, GTP cyclohydrolase I [Candidatus Peregrinibacteria bacterium GW2011_GWC2_33_13]OGJ50110.1 MAG: GTP cyclohydrolase I FolE [Candidatus Peregrinibacteria bacterium RIFOXYA2_FULL_33_7]
MLEKNIEEIIRSTGEDINREGLKGTPKRVVDSYATIFSGYKMNPQDILTIFDDENYDQMIISKDIEFYSTCEHHLLPFFGKAHIGYIPNGKIIGLSKLPRLVDIFSRRLQNQERLTKQIADTLQEILSPKGVGVVLEAKHMCIMARGVQKQGTLMTTSAVTGLFKNNQNTRSEFLNLIK